MVVLVIEYDSTQFDYGDFNQIFDKKHYYFELLINQLCFHVRRVLNLNTTQVIHPFWNSKFYLLVRDPFVEARKCRGFWWGTFLLKNLKRYGLWTSCILSKKVVCLVIPSFQNY